VRLWNTLVTNRVRSGRARSRLLVATQQHAPPAIGHFLLQFGQLPHEVVFGLDVDEEIPGPAAERRRMFRQGRQQGHAPLTFDVVDRGGVLRPELLREGEHGAFP